MCLVANCQIALATGRRGSTFMWLDFWNQWPRVVASRCTSAWTKSVIQCISFRRALLSNRMSMKTSPHNWSRGPYSFHLPAFVGWTKSEALGEKERRKSEFLSFHMSSNVAKFWTSTGKSQHYRVTDNRKENSTKVSSFPGSTFGILLNYVAQKKPHKNTSQAAIDLLVVTRRTNVVTNSVVTASSSSPCSAQQTRGLEGALLGYYFDLTIGGQWSVHDKAWQWSGFAG